MGLANFSELQASIANWLNRDDLTASIPDFITLAELRIKRRLRIPILETSTTLLTVASTETVALPSDFGGMRSLYLDQSPDNPLVGKTISTLIATFPDDSPGTPLSFAVSGSNLHLRPIPSAVLNLEMVYHAKVADLSDAAPTNTMLTNNPDVYLYGALMEAAPFLQDDPRINTWASLLEAGFTDIEKDAEKQLFSSPNLEVTVNLT